MTLSDTAWRRAKDVLADALDLPEAQRAALVAARCAGDPALLEEVQSLLGHAAGLTAFEAPALAPRDFAGRRAGAYILTHEIGHGGMGVVYAAQRADGAYQQTVAVKLLRGVPGDALEARRMGRERQALAALNHPNIARLLDGGSLDDGIPYLVMELVTGQAIDVYCNELQLTIAQRVQLALKVCAAVQAAHQQLLIHRDIKPSNILVSSDGVVKLLDFGVARLMESDAGATQDAAMLFTPRYASPEQVRGLPVSIATDVHGIGLLLYDLLAGGSPYERLGSATASSVADAVRAVLDDLPRKASQIAARSAPAHLRQLGGELDTILLKACAKDADARYGTVSELAGDLQRWLDGKPILARPHAWHYVARKFLGRHPVGSVLGVLALVAIGAGVAGTWQQKNEAMRHQALAEARSAQVRQFANQMIFNYYDAIENLPGSLPVRKKLVQDALAYLDTLGAGELADADMGVELASGYRKLAHLLYNGANLAHLGDEAAATKARAKSMAVLDKVLAREPNHIKANIAWAETNSDMAVLLGAAGETEAALAAMQASAQRYERILAIKPGDPAIQFELIYTHLRTAQAAMNGKAPARAYLDKAELAFKQWSAGRDKDPEVPNMHAFLVRTQYRDAAAAKDWPRAFALIEQEVAILDKELVTDPDNATYQAHKATALVSYAVHKNALGEPVVALPYQQRSHAIREALLARSPDDMQLMSQIARSFAHRGNIYLKLEDKAAALTAFQASARLYDKMLGTEQPASVVRQAAETLHLLSTTLASMGQRAQSREAALALLKIAGKHAALFEQEPAAGWLKQAQTR